MGSDECTHRSICLLACICRISVIFWPRCLVLCGESLMSFEMYEYARLYDVARIMKSSVLVPFDSQKGCHECASRRSRGGQCREGSGVIVGRLYICLWLILTIFLLFALQTGSDECTGGRRRGGWWIWRRGDWILVDWADRVYIKFGVRLGKYGIFTGELLCWCHGLKRAILVCWADRVCRAATKISHAGILLRDVYGVMRA